MTPSKAPPKTKRSAIGRVTKIGRIPCAHPGPYHLGSDGLSIVRPHPQADSCFARTQGYVIAKVEEWARPAAADIVAAMNAADVTIGDRATYYKGKRDVCPHCGNLDSRFMQDNGCRRADPLFTLLCVARVKPGDDAFGGDADPPLDVDAAGTVACGMQWNPGEHEASS
jgi:hypothetical protein